MQGKRTEPLCPQQLSNVITPRFALYEDDGKRHLLPTAFSLPWFFQQHCCDIIQLLSVGGFLKGLGDIGCRGADLTNLYSKGKWSILRQSRESCRQSDYASSHKHVKMQQLETLVDILKLSGQMPMQVTE